jgi:hypothetical protein
MRQAGITIALVLATCILLAQENKALQKAQLPLKLAFIKLNAKNYTATMHKELSLNTKQAVKVYLLRKNLSYYVYEAYNACKDNKNKIIRQLKPHKENFESGLKKTLLPQQYIAWNEFRKEQIAKIIEQRKNREMDNQQPQKPVIKNNQPFILADYLFDE